MAGPFQANRKAAATHFLQPCLAGKHFRMHNTLNLEAELYSCQLRTGTWATLGTGLPKQEKLPGWLEIFPDLMNFHFYCSTNVLLIVGSVSVMVYEYSHQIIQVPAWNCSAVCKLNSWPVVCYHKPGSSCRKVTCCDAEDIKWHGTWIKVRIHNILVEFILWRMGVQGHPTEY